MRIDGLWQQSTDQSGTVRPVITAKLHINNQILPITLLVDTGADCTMLGSAFAEILEDIQQSTNSSFLSAGGQLDCFVAPVTLEFQDTNNRPVKFSVPCVVLKDPDQQNEHLLGRDVLDHFTLICDRSTEQVILLRPPHHYSIQHLSNG